jgi:hypothetical protein
VLFLAPLERLRQTALVGDIYTPAVKKELARCYRLLYMPEQLQGLLQREGARTLEELIDKRHAAAPEKALPQLEGLEPSDAWRKGS